MPLHSECTIANLSTFLIESNYFVAQAIDCSVELNENESADIAEKRIRHFGSALSVGLCDKLASRLRKAAQYRYRWRRKLRACFSNLYIRFKILRNFIPPFQFGMVICAVCKVVSSIVSSVYFAIVFLIQQSKEDCGLRSEESHFVALLFQFYVGLVLCFNGGRCSAIASALEGYFLWENGIGCFAAVLTVKLKWLTGFTIGYALGRDLLPLVLKMKTASTLKLIYGKAIMICVAWMLSMRWLAFIHCSLRGAIMCTYILRKILVMAGFVGHINQFRRNTLLLSIFVFAFCGFVFPLPEMLSMQLIAWLDGLARSVVGEAI
jgi:hypothetical protein